MNVIFTIKDKEYVVGIMDAKRILNNIYECCTSVNINGDDVEVDRAARMEIMKQLHGELYV